RTAELGTRRESALHGRGDSADGASREHVPLRGALQESDRRLLLARALQRVERIHDRLVSSHRRRRLAAGEKLSPRGTHVVASSFPSQREPAITSHLLLV